MQAAKRKIEVLIILMGKQTTMKRKMKKMRGRVIKTNKMIHGYGHCNPVVKL